MTIESEGLQCSCGNHGCLEMYASERALIHRYQMLTKSKHSSEDILARLQSGEQAAKEAVHTIGTYLGIGLSNLINGLNPSLILIGNRLAQAGDWLLHPIQQTIQTRCFSVPYAPVTIRMSALGRNACAIGAAALVLHEHFAGPQSA
ncbi:hypothetical protein GCM10025857_06150 [Alicyclobacillus contaminans]|nr:hypothetical protein GCM10025857_06150 [Alicyclobacillus contaminans]